jgi:hypothetical protein
MKKADDAVWLAFTALAKTYPHDNGVRITADLSRWLLEERQRLGLLTPPNMQRALDAVPGNQHGRKDPDIDDLMRLHIEAWSRLAELIDACKKQRDAGNLKVAQHTFRHARRLLDEINALEQGVRNAGPLWQPARAAPLRETPACSHKKP